MTVNISHKIKMGRAALDWTRDDLAAATGLSAGTVRDIELGQSAGSQRSVDAMIKAFESRGVYFTENGVEMRQSYITTVSDYIDVLNAIEQSGAKEVYVDCADESRSSDAVRAKVLQMRQSGIDFKVTICEGDTRVNGDVSLYRWVPADYFADMDVSVMFGDKTVQHISDGHFLIIHDADYAAKMKKRFLSMWNNGKKVQS